jgi:hypothetical protein
MDKCQFVIGVDVMLAKFWTEFRRRYHLRFYFLILKLLFLINYIDKCEFVIGVDMTFAKFWTEFRRRYHLRFYVNYMYLL